MIKKDKSKDLEAHLCDVPAVDYDPISNSWVKICNTYFRLGVDQVCYDPKWAKCHSNVYKPYKQIECPKGYGCDNNDESNNVD